jgi:hypothetical protein
MGSAESLRRAADLLATGDWEGAHPIVQGETMVSRLHGGPRQYFGGRVQVDWPTAGAEFSGGHVAQDAGQGRPPRA